MKDNRSYNPTYTKRDVAKIAAQKSNTNVGEALLWVDKICDAMREIMQTAKPELRIEIRDFGVFEVKLTKPKPAARNPKTGEIIYIPSRRKTHFKPSKLLKKFLSQPLDKETVEELFR